ncbi:MAG TPA: efflux transporter outer membrane subunit [Candidatus Babeliales bacterium]|nr:efflux transporter outer membrane subunit [Candidatus Babeliales bacterium]
MKRRKMFPLGFRRTFALAAALGASACNNPTPPPVPPPPPSGGYGNVPPQTAAAPGPAGAAQRFLRDMDVPGQWWQLFHSVQLNAFIDEALARNPDVDAAQAALRAARETAYAQRTSAYPNAQLSYSVSPQEFPTFLAPPLSVSSTEYAYWLHTVSLNVSYTADVFGNLRYETRSAEAAAEAQRYQLEATYLTLTSNVVAATVQAASLRDQIDATKRIIAIDDELLRLTQAQQQNAQASGLDVLNAESALRQAEQTLPPLESSFEQTRTQLARLLGRAPSNAPAVDFGLAALHLPETLPLSFPSKLIAGRPDVAAASANLAQAAAAVGVAYTNRLPNFPITAQVATQALKFVGLFGPGSLLSALAAEIATTIYDQGTLKHRQESAVAAYNEAVAQYRGTVLSGFEDVANSVIALTNDADELVAAERSESTARKALDIVVSQRDVGEVSSVASLTAEQTYEQTVIARVQAQATRYSDTAGLFDALGGGWWNRQDSQ